MIAQDRDRVPTPDHADPRPTGQVPPGLPPGASWSDRRLQTGEVLEVLSVPLDAAAPPPAGLNAVPDATDDVIRHWLTAASATQAAVVSVPLYGCHVAWTAGRAAVHGPRDRLAALEEAVGEFADVEAELRAVEARGKALLEALDTDLAMSLAIEPHVPDRRAESAARHREAVAVARRLAVLAPLAHAPPLHPPTLASQLGERLRERTRLVERHEFATQRAELAERVAEACGQRALEVGIARRQIGLEWAIVILLVVQTVLLVVELLAQRAAP